MLLRLADHQRRSEARALRERHNSIEWAFCGDVRLEIVDGSEAAFRRSFIEIGEEFYLGREKRAQFCASVGQQRAVSVMAEREAPVSRSRICSHQAQQERGSIPPRNQTYDFCQARVLAPLVIVSASPASVTLHLMIRSRKRSAGYPSASRTPVGKTDYGVSQMHLGRSMLL